MLWSKESCFPRLVPGVPRPTTVLQFVYHTCSICKVCVVAQNHLLRTMNVQALRDRLVANDATLTELQILLYGASDAELKLILDAAKKNKTVKKVRVVGCYRGRGRSLSVPAALSLASVVSEHHEIQEIEFCAVTGIKVWSDCSCDPAESQVDSSPVRKVSGNPKSRRMHSLASHRECTRAYDPTKQLKRWITAL
jgi:hypothetical protein